MKQVGGFHCFCKKKETKLKWVIKILLSLNIKLRRESYTKNFDDGMCNATRLSLYCRINYNAC